MKPFWIPPWLTPSGTPTLRKPPRRVRPILEALEDRCVPSIVVNNPTDTAVAGETDLRQAIAQANTDEGAETITFDPMVFSTRQTINLTGGQLELSDTTGPETITGPSVGVTVNGGGLSRVFQVDNLVTASISGLTITGGNAGSGNGGGVLNEGSVALTNCTISGNAAGGSYPGGFGGGRVQLLRNARPHQLYRQRQLRHLLRRRLRGWPWQHGHADQLHRQRQLR